MIGSNSENTWSISKEKCQINPKKVLFNEINETFSQKNGPIYFTKFYSFPRVKYQILDSIHLDLIHGEYSHNLWTNIHY
jgi:hypothetical protein